jgi:hypothetical protein
VYLIVKVLFLKEMMTYDIPFIIDDAYKVDYDRKPGD